jgi:hypothetical protein
MAGILDNKKRIMDTIVTQEGRRQLSSGNFKIKYASFTDGNVFYEEDLLTGTTDATLRIPFEVVNKFQDNIVFETDDSGNLLSFQGTDVELNADGSIVSLTSTYPNDTRIYNGKVVVEIKGQTAAGLNKFYYYDEDTEEIVCWIYGYADDADGGSGATGIWDETGTEDPDGYGWFLTDNTYAWPTPAADKSDILSTENFITNTISSRSVVTDSEGFSSAVDSITAASFESFNQQNFITTRDKRNNIDFSISQSKDEFTYTIGSGYDNEVVFIKELDTLPAFIHDNRLANVLNFKYLPPNNYNDKTPNGTYADLNNGHDLTRDDIRRMTFKKQSIVCRVNSSENNNKIMMQIFEENSAYKKIKKLDMIDAGSFNTSDGFKRIIFVGKVMIDSLSQPTFINMFTIEMSK